MLIFSGLWLCAKSWCKVTDFYLLNEMVKGIFYFVKC